MTFDNNTALKSEHQQKQFRHLSDANTSQTVVKSRIFLRFAAWYGFWLVLVLALYWPVLPALPYRDHPYLMLNHQLAENDWQWFWSMLSYPRTRILLPGDYFAFRPVHMAIIGLQDMFLRYHLVAQGVVNCIQFAFAATVFCSMAKRFVGPLAALAFTFLWVAQLAGAAIVMWQHITPYILCPAFFIAALRILDGDDLSLSPRTKEVIAAIFVCTATLIHEIGIATALSVSILAILFGSRDAVRRRQLLMTFLVPVTCSLLLNMIDYFIIHPTPSLMGPADVLSSQTSITLMVEFIGAIGTAFLASPALHLEQLPDGFTIWQFYNESSLLLTCMAILVFALLVTVCATVVRELRQAGISSRSLFMTFLLSFFMATFVVCAFRMYFREPNYMSKAPYYYSLFSLTLSGMAVCLLYAAKRTVINSVATVVLMAGVVHATASQTYFRETEDQRKTTYTVIVEGRKILTQNPGLCFSGAMPLSTSFGSLFHDVSCINRPGAMPLYIHSNGKNGVWLSSALYSSNNSRMIPAQIPSAFKLPADGGWVTSLAIPYGHDLQFTANKVGNIAIVLTDQTGIQQSVTIERNLLKKSVQKAVWLSPVMDEAALDLDSATNMITYKLGFAQEKIALFADGRWIGNLPPPPPETISLNMVLRSTDKIKADIGNMYISEHPSQGSLQLFSRFSLVAQ